jgi:hypothetical protein
LSDKPISAAEVPGFNLLTPREQMFVQHPEVYRDPRKAALDCGYSSATIEKRSYSMRQRLMRFIRPAFEHRLAQVSVNRERVEEELAAIAFTIEDEFKERVDIEMADGGFQSIVVWKDPATLPAHMRRAIKSVEWGYETLADGAVVQSDRPTHITLYSKEKALHELAGLFGDVAPKTPVDDQQTLLDNLNDEERGRIVQLYRTAATRAAAKNLAIEGDHVESPPVRRIEAPSPRRDEPVRVRDEGRKGPEDQPDNTEQPPVKRRVRKGEREPVVVRESGEDADAGYLELPD